MAAKNVAATRERNFENSLLASRMLDRYRKQNKWQKDSLSFWTSVSLYATSFAAMSSFCLLKREEGHEMNQGLRKRGKNTKNLSLKNRASRECQTHPWTEEKNSSVHAAGWLLKSTLWSPAYLWRCCPLSFQPLPERVTSLANLPLLGSHKWLPGWCPVKADSG